MSRTLIITAHVEHLNHVQLNFNEFDQIICADGGFLIAEKLGLSPTILIGDYDSMELPDRADFIKLPMEKDMTDTEAALDLAVNQGFDHITILGGLGGRFDHTMGNLGLLAKYCGKLKHLSFVDGQNHISMIGPGTIEISKNDYPYLGIISYGGTATGVTLDGVKYPLKDFDLPDTTSLGVSNEITSSRATITLQTGKLLIILSKDIDKQEK